jgi:uncharacterized protein YkwD
MNITPTGPNQASRFLAWARQSLIARVAMIGAGGALVVGSAGFLLAGWDDEPAPTSAAQLEAQPTDVTLGNSLGRLDADELTGGLVRLVVALIPTPTPTPKPTATPVPTPTDVPYVPPSAAPYVPPPSDPVAPAPPPSSAPASGCPTAGMGGFAQSMFNSANSERTSRGLPALAVHGCVVYVANIRSNDMAANNYFSHTSPNGSTAFSLLDQYGVPHGWAGENLARNNYPSNEAVQIAMRDLMNSQGHRDNILSPNYTHMGIGYANDGTGMHYFTMVFIGQ